MEPLVARVGNLDADGPSFLFGVEAAGLQLSADLHEVAVNAVLLEQGGDLRNEVAATKIFCTENVGRVADTAVQLVGGLALVIQTSPKLALIIALIWPPIYFGTSMFSGRNRRAGGNDGSIPTSPKYRAKALELLVDGQKH